MPIRLKSLLAEPAAKSASSTDLSQVGNTIGEIKYAQDNDALFFWNGSAWRKITTTNDPVTLVDGGLGSYRLPTDGTPLTFTLDATDPEGLPIAWSYEVTSGTLGNTATIELSGNEVTITPSTNNEDSGTFEVTFTGTDGENEVTATNEFILSFTTDPGEQIFTSSSSFTVPTDVYSICGVAVGTGGGSKGVDRDGIDLDRNYYGKNDDVIWSGGGGALAYVNNVAVVPGEVLTVTVDGNKSQVERADGTVILKAEAGVGSQSNQRGGRASECIGDAAYSGGNGSTKSYAAGHFRYSFSHCGGGGAGGYDIDGGNAGERYRSGTTGGDNRDAGGSDARTSVVGGGGVGLFGGTATYIGDVYGQGNWGGANAQAGDGEQGQGRYASSTADALGAAYGGGAGFAYSDQFGIYRRNPNNSNGAVRIIWGGHDPAGRAFPNTNTALSSTL